jgi:formate/nitrite transporter FocA (FNT family)
MNHAITVGDVLRLIGACILVSTLGTFIFWLVVRTSKTLLDQRVDRS